MSNISTSLLQPTDTVFIVSCLLFCVVLGISGERLGWFGKVSGVLVTIALAAVMTTVGVLPSASDPEMHVPTYHFVYDYVIPISIPLLLFNVNLRRIIRESGRLVLGFIIGALGIVLGALIAHSLLPLGPESYKIAGVYVGTYTGGSVNFMAVASTLDFLDSPMFPAVITIDNVFTNLYFMFLFFLPALGFIKRRYRNYEEDPVPTSQIIEQSKPMALLEGLAISLLVSFAIFSLAKLLSPLLQDLLDTDTNLEILVITVLIAILANAAPRWLQRYESVAFDLGMLLLIFFLAVIGAACDLTVLLSSSFTLLGFVVVTLIVHLVVILLAGRLLNLSLEEVLVASAANAGGPSISAPMAANFGMKRTVTPAILVAILGYLIGTFLGVGVGFFLQ